MLQLWSLFTDRLMWTRPVVIEKSYNMDSLLPSRCFNARWLNSWLEKRKGWQNQGVYCCAVFSPKELQLLVVSAVGLLVLDAKTGNTPRTFLRHYLFFIIWISSVTRNALFLIPIQLFNIKSGKVQLMSRVRWPVCFLYRRLFAIDLKSAMPIFKTVFGVHLPRGEYTFLNIFKSAMLVTFSGICYRAQEKEIKRKLQCKVQKLTNWVLLCNTPALIKMRPDSNVAFHMSSF